MATRTPIVQVVGELQQLQAGDTIGGVVSQPLNADAPNSVIPINVLTGSPATLVSKSITYAAKDQVIIRVYGAIVNNSGFTNTYALRFAIGAFTLDLTFASTIVTSSTNRQVVFIEVTFSVASTSSTWIQAKTDSGIPVALGSGQQISPAYTLQIVQHSSSNLTGTQTTSVQMYSTNGIATQSFELGAWSIDKFATNP